MDDTSPGNIVCPAPGMAHLLRVRQKGLAPPQRLLSALAILDVNCRSVPSSDVSCLIAQWRAVNQEPAIFTIDSSSQTRFILERPPARQRCAPPFDMFADVFGMKDCLPTRAGRLLG